MNALEQALYDRLRGSADLTNLLGGEYIYNNLAPDNASLPFVIFSLVSGTDDNVSPTRSRNFVYVVKVVTDRGLAAAGDIEEVIDRLLHNQTLTVDDWRNFWIAREGTVRYVEVEQGFSYYHVGGTYRIRLSK